MRCFSEILGKIKANGAEKQGSRGALAAGGGGVAMFHDDREKLGKIAFCLKWAHAANGLPGIQRGGLQSGE